MKLNIKKNNFTLYLKRFDEAYNFAIENESVLNRVLFVVQ